MTGAPLYNRPKAGLPLVAATWRLRRDPSVRDRQCRGRWPGA